MNKKNKTTIKEKNKNSNTPRIAKFNRNLVSLIIIVFIVLIGIITTAIQAKENNISVNSEETTSSVTWIESTERDENGNPIRVPVPKGYTASQIDGETTVSGGFVIYEGEIDDWSKYKLKSDEIETESSVEAQSATVKSRKSNKNISENVNDNENITVDTNNVDTTKEETIKENNTINEEKSKTKEAEAKEQKLNTNTTEIDEEENKNNEETTEGQSTIDNTEKNNNVVENIIEEKTEKKENEEVTNTVDEKTNVTKQKETVAVKNSAMKVAEVDSENNTADTANDEVKANIFELQKSVNQYVWVPVKDISGIFGVDANGKLWGKLYSYNSNAKTRVSLNWTETNGIMNITSKTSYREPDVINSIDKIDVDKYLQYYFGGITKYELLSQELEENFYFMIKSIKEYGGFYIGRYEMGGLNGTAVVRKMDVNISSQNWYTMYKKCKMLSATNNSIKTSMIWGSLWDTTLKWFVDSNATNLAGQTITYDLIYLNSRTWGNYSGSSIEYINSDGETITKEKSERIPAGSSEYTRVNNIYDMAGNVQEATLECGTTKTYRGKTYDINGNNFAGYREPTYSYYDNSVYNYRSRL